MQNKQSKLETSISKLEKEIKDIDLELSINYEETIAKANFFDEYHEKKNQIENLMIEWEELTQKIEKLT